MDWAVKQPMEETQLAHIADFDGRFADALMASVSSEPELHLFQVEILLEARRKPEIRAKVEHLYATYVSTVEDAVRRSGIDTGGKRRRRSSRLWMDSCSSTSRWATRPGSGPPLYTWLISCPGCKIPGQPSRTRTLIRH